MKTYRITIIDIYTKTERVIERSATNRDEAFTIGTYNCHLWETVKSITEIS